MAVVGGVGWGGQCGQDGEREVGAECLKNRLPPLSPTTDPHPLSLCTRRLVLYIVPNFAFGQALFDMFINQAYGELCGLGNDDACDLYKDNYTSVWEPGVGLQAIYLFFGGVFWFTLLLLGEAGVFPKREPKAFRSPSRDEEADVAAERARVLSSASNDDRLIVKGLTKVYKKKGGSGRFTAVDNLAFGVPAGHCFGLLGVNGAGKTTTFNALTGEIPATKGEIVAAGYNLRNNSSKARRNMGYCPQYDALIGLLVGDWGRNVVSPARPAVQPAHFSSPPAHLHPPLLQTGREHLEIYARLRGVREAEVGTMVSDLIRRLDLGMYADKPSYTYSGGNKRKLSTAIALVAGPKLVLLDEPTTVCLAETEGRGGGSKGGGRKGQNSEMRRSTGRITSVPGGLRATRLLATGHGPRRATLSLVRPQRRACQRPVDHPDLAQHGGEPGRRVVGAVATLRSIFSWHFRP